MTKRPDIIIMLADDLGYSDIGCFGAEIPTPHLDALAMRGVRQTRFYNCARCCPSRASLLTGVHPHRAGIGQMTADRGIPGYRGFLDPLIPTIAERLRQAGYDTWISGKWHVGGDYAVHRPEQWRQAGDEHHPLPTQRGFRRCYSTLGGAGSYFAPPTLLDQERFISPAELPEDYYLTDELGRRAVSFLTECPAGQPSFGYLAFTAPHWPLHAPEKDIAPHRGRYRAGWDMLRRERLARQIALGIVPPDQMLSERDPQSRPWESTPDQAWEDERMAVYAAQIVAMDRAIGEVVAVQQRRGRLDDTLFVFLSDNGGCAEYLQEDGEPGRWPEMYALPDRTGHITKVGNDRRRQPGPADTFMSYDLPWSNASNTPFRKFKAWTHEGGISSPLIACWPAMLPAGAIRHGVGHIIDLAATACTIAGLPTDGIDGCDLLPVWRDGTETVRAEPLCWEHQGHAAACDGNWKIVRTSSGSPWELYDLTHDRVEEHDLVTQHPSVVSRLEAAWTRWATRCGVRPWPLKTTA